MLNKMIPITAIALLMLVGCDETSSETAKDVSEAREEAAEDITETRQDANRMTNRADQDVVDAQKDFSRTDQKAMDDLSEAEADAMTKTARANFDVAEAEAEGRYKVAKERCDAFTDASKDSCLSNAENTRTAELAAAASKRDNALLTAKSNQ